MWHQSGAWILGDFGGKRNCVTLHYTKPPITLSYYWKVQEWFSIVKPLRESPRNEGRARRPLSLKGNLRTSPPSPLPSARPSFLPCSLPFRMKPGPLRRSGGVGAYIFLCALAFLLLCRPRPPARLNKIRAVPLFFPLKSFGTRNPAASPCRGPGI